MAHLGKNVALLFEQGAERFGDRIALTCEGQAISYAALNRRANRLAHYLKANQIAYEDRVCLLSETSIDTIVSILAILKAGGVYVPIDPTYPADYRRRILRDVRPQTLLTTSEYLAPDFENTRLIVLDEIADDVSSCSESNLQPANSSQSLAYIIYTSGTTGEPKGIAGIHESITNGLAWPPRDQTADGEVWGLNQSLSVGASISRLFLALLCGIRLVLVPQSASRNADGLLDEIQRERITNVLFITPLFYQILRHYSGARDRLSHVQSFLLGGASLPPDLIAMARDRFPDSRIMNGYACSEAGGAVHVWVVDSHTNEERTFPNTTLHLLDENLVPVPNGTIGEIYIGAAHLARGYWADPALTSERFIPDPFGSTPGSRLFRTGDCGKRLDDGTLELHGRTDEQIKIRGYRVELQQVEGALRKCPHVHDAGVVYLQERSQLLAFIVGDETVVTGQRLREHLDRFLPEYMMPSVFSLVSEIPLTPAGKVDRAALRRIAIESARTTSEERTPMAHSQHVLLAIWEDALGLDVGMDDDFFDLGGNSLVAMQIIGRIHSALNVRIDLDEFLTRRTINGLTTWMAQRSAQTISADYQPIHRIRPDEQPVIPPQQEPALQASLHHAPYQSLVRLGLSLEGDVDVSILQESFNRVIDRHEILRTSYTPVLKIGPAFVRGWPHVRAWLPRDENRLASITYQQTIVDDVWMELRVIDRREGAASAHADSDGIDDCLHRHFDYSSPPFVRAVLIHFSSINHALYVVMPHLVSDAWSTRVFARELEACYSALLEGRAPVLRPLPIQYRDFAAWQHAYLPTFEERDRQVEMLERSSLLFSRYNKPSFGLRHDDPHRCTILLDQATSANVRHSSQSQSLTPSMMIFAAFAILLHLASGKKRLGIRIMQANRIHPDLENLIGFIASGNILNIDCSDDPTVLDIYAQVRSEFAAAARRRHYTPMTPRGEGRHASFVFERLGSIDPGNDAGRFRLFKVLTKEKQISSMKLAVDEGADDIAIVCDYCFDCFTAPLMTELLASMERLIEAMIVSSSGRITALAGKLSPSLLRA